MTTSQSVAEVLPSCAAFLAGYAACLLQDRLRRRRAPQTPRVIVYRDTIAIPPEPPAMPRRVQRGPQLPTIRKRQP